MFLARGIFVSCSLAVIAYAMASVMVSAIWKPVWRQARRHSAKNCADLLFALRITPLLVSIGLTFAFTVPSFVLFEPRAAIEPIGLAPVLLSLAALAGMLWGAWNAGSALLRASRAVVEWKSASSRISPRAFTSDRSVQVFRSSNVLAPLTVAGILKPTIWVSHKVEPLLTEGELQTALNHEVAHVRRNDNLRKLVIRLLAFPGMSGLENAWRAATEIAADDAAVTTASEALDLAGAMIKLSRFACPPAELTTALVHSPAEFIDARVKRLIAWPDTAPATGAPRYAFCAMAAFALVVAATYVHLLIFVHAATEFLVR